MAPNLDEFVMQPPTPAQIATAQVVAMAMCKTLNDLAYLACIDQNSL